MDPGDWRLLGGLGLELPEFLLCPTLDLVVKGFFFAALSVSSSDKLTSESWSFWTFWAVLELSGRFGV